MPKPSITAAFDVMTLIVGLMLERRSQTGTSARAYAEARLDLQRHEGPEEGPVYEAKLERLRRASIAWDAEAFRLARETKEPA